MMKPTLSDTSDDLADFPPEEPFPLEAAPIEVRIDARGRRHFRIAGICMAWCRSISEARRVATILWRATHARPAAQRNADAHAPLSQRLLAGLHGGFAKDSIAA